MKNPEKTFFEAQRLFHLATYPTLEGKNISNPELYKIAERISLEAQEEMGRQNKKAMKIGLCHHCGKKRKELRMCCYKK